MPGQLEGLKHFDKRRDSLRAELKKTAEPQERSKILGLLGALREERNSFVIKLKKEAEAGDPEAVRIVEVFRHRADQD